MMIFVAFALYRVDPCGRKGHFIEVELARVQKALKRDIAPVALEDPGLGLQLSLIHL